MIEMLKILYLWSFLSVPFSILTIIAGEYCDDYGPVRNALLRWLYAVSMLFALPIYLVYTISSHFQDSHDPEYRHKLMFRNWQVTVFGVILALLFIASPFVILFETRQENITQNQQWQEQIQQVYDMGLEEGKEIGYSDGYKDALAYYGISD